MGRSLPLIVLLSSLLVMPACGLPNTAPTASDIDSGFAVFVGNAAVKFTAVAGATVKALGQVCTTSESGGCELPNMPFATISVTVSHPNFVELTQDVVKKKGVLNFFTFELQPK